MKCENCKICKGDIGSQAFEAIGATADVFGKVIGTLASAVGVEEVPETDIHKDHEFCSKCGHCINCYHQ